MRKPAKTERAALARMKVGNDIAKELCKQARKAILNDIEFADWLRGAIVAYEEASK